VRLNTKLTFLPKIVLIVLIVFFLVIPVCDNASGNTLPLSLDEQCEILYDLLQSMEESKDGNRIIFLGVGAGHIAIGLQDMSDEKLMDEIAAIPGIDRNTLKFVTWEVGEWGWNSSE
jgi:hypothetical protein